MTSAGLKIGQHRIKAACTLAIVGAATILGFGTSGLTQETSRSAALSSAQTVNDDHCVPAWNTFVGHSRLSSTILSSARASDGFIYLGGGDGLYRIEGGRVRDFRPDFYDKSALPAGRIGALVADGPQLWVGTGAGLARFILETGAFERIDLPDASGRIEVRALAKTPAGLIIGTDQGAFLRAGGKVRRLAVSDSGPDENLVINAIATHGQRTVLGTAKGLFEWRGADQIRRLSSPLDAENVIAVRFAPDARIWGVTVDTLFAEPHKHGAQWSLYPQAETKGLPKDVLTTLEFDPRGRLWVASRNGLARANDPEGIFVPCRRAINGSDPDSDMGVVHLSFDLGPYVLAGTSGSGATHAPVSGDVRIILPGAPQNPGLPAGSPWNAHKLADGRLLIGTAAGLYMEAAKNSGTFRPVSPAVLGERLIYSALPDKGRIWVGTDRGLYVVEANGAARQVNLLASGGGGTALPIFALKRHKSEILVGAFGGLFVLDGSDGATRLYFRANKENVPSGNPRIVDIPGTRVWSLDPAGKTVLATGDAMVLMLDIEQGSLIGSTEAASEDGKFAAGRVYTALREGPDTILIGTESGLVVTDPAFEKFEPLRMINALKLEAVPVLGRAPDGQIWLGAAGNGLFHRRPGSKDWSRVGQDDGLVTHGVGQLGLSFAEDGSVLITNGNGASIISPTRAQSTRTTKATDVFVFEAVSGKALTPDRRRLVVEPENRDLTIQFALPEILETGEYFVDYRFAREGENAEIKSISLGDDLNILQPAPGSYLLSGRVVSAAGQASRPFAYEIEIRPFWWERQITYVILFAALISLGIWALRMIERARQRRLELLTAERRRIAQSLHDSTLQDMYGALLLSRSLDGSSAAGSEVTRSEQIAELLSSATSSLRRSIDINGERQEVAELSEAIRKFRPPASLARPVAIEFSEEGKPWHLGTHRAFCLLQIVTEALNNAAKHAEAASISVDLRWSFWSLAITICDDGKGYDATSHDAERGFGLGGMRRMADAAHVRLATESMPGEGTRVRIIAHRFVL